jgi:hypothetical protein
LSDFIDKKKKSNLISTIHLEEISVIKVFLNFHVAENKCIEVEKNRFYFLN